MKGVPIGRTASIDLPNSHLTYLITWFAFIQVSNSSH
jgi:cytochrome oxidase assembly protein ShyY1